MANVSQVLHLFLSQAVEEFEELALAWEPPAHEAWILQSAGANQAPASKQRGSVLVENRTLDRQELAGMFADGV
jgi:hypothetical protein